MVLAFHLMTLRWAEVFSANSDFDSVRLRLRIVPCVWLMIDSVSSVPFFLGLFSHCDRQRGIDTEESRCTGTNNGTKHFNPKVACHGLYELQRDNKAVVYSGLKRCPCVMWGCNKSTSFSLQVESPLAVDAVLGEAAFSVTDDKVSITELRVHAISGLTLSLQPSPGNSHTMVAKATGIQTLAAPKQVQTRVITQCRVIVHF